MKRVLIVDDDPQFRALIVPLLTARNVRVQEAASGRAASTILEHERPDLIVVDGLLPDTDGLKWIQRLRESGVTTPIIFASAFWKDKKTFQKLTMELGVAAVVQKPVQPEVFVAHIETELKKYVSVDDIEITEEEPEDDVELDIEDELAALRRNYALSLPGKSDDLSVAINAYLAGTAGALDDARGLAHRLRGTAGSYGFDQVGDVAGLIEEDAITLSGAGSPSHEIGERLLSNARRLTSLTIAAAASIEPTQPPVPEAASSEQILVVDRDPSFLTQIQELARRHAVEIIPARSREAALETVQRVRPDAAILEASLDTASDTSFKLAQTLRTLPGCEALPIAFVSSQPNVETRVAAAHAGGSIFLTKPVDHTAFGDALHQLLAMRPERPRVLLLDDDPDFRAHVAVLLQREGMSVLSIGDPTRILDHLTRFRPDLLLLDVSLPQMSGFDLCRMLRTSREWRDLPIFFLTAKTGIETRVTAFRSGGDDYLAKPVVPEELLARIHARMERINLMRDRAERDALTGVLLRRSFMSRFEAHVSEGVRRQRPVSFVILDVDRFKQINDENGHLSGDRVLSGFGKLLTTRFRATDLRGRWGGDEFVLCFPGEPVETTAGIVERLLEDLRKMSFESDNGGRFGVSFTAGIAAFPADGSTVHDVVKAADRRLLSAKRAGRNRVHSRDD